MQVEGNHEAVTTGSLVLVRYGEIGLKGKNRHFFEKRLVDNMKRALGDLGPVTVKRLQGRFLLAIGGIPFDEAAQRLRRVFGIASFSPVWRVPAVEEQIYQTSLLSLQSKLERKNLAGTSEPVTFRVTVKRADKSFPLDSMELSRQVGAHLLRNMPGLKVDLHKPRIVVSVDVREGQAYIFCDTLPGPGGLPVGVSGKGVLLLSGGIDSPVAGWMCLKRGIETEAIHFHSFPFTGEKSKEKVIDLCRVLARYGGNIRLHVAHFTEIQKEIQKNCPEEIRVTVMRRFMFRLARRLAEKTGALALITGESVGQVASQTLESMTATSDVAEMLVLRPLVGFDKAEIVDLARRVGTYDISVRPYEDCCTLFLPRNPSTRPRLEKVRRAEENLDVEALVEDALQEIETLDLNGD